jgi:hypothetical protein
MPKYFLFLFLILSSQKLSAQLSLDSINTYSFVVINDTIAENRIAANEKLNTQVMKILKSEKSYNLDWNEVPQIKCIESEDKKFKLITWQLWSGEGNYQYFGYLQTNQKKPKVYELNDKFLEIRNINTDVTSSKNWLGTITYNIKKFKTSKGVKYLLFGYHKQDQYTNVKIVDVLNFSESSISFGAPIFEKKIKNKKKSTYRLILEYSSKATAHMNYDEQMEMIVFDHVEPMGVTSVDEGMQYIPDGTYEAYTLKKGIFTYIEQLPTTPMETAPVPKPVFGKEKKDLFGKEKAVKSEKLKTKSE